jgi:peptide methionine sulfoxide reductase MsrA
VSKQIRIRGAILPEVEALANYSTAEACRQHYFPNNPEQGYCPAMIGPRLVKFRKVSPPRRMRDLTAPSE